MHTSNNAITPAQVAGKAPESVQQARKSLSRVNKAKMTREIEYKLAGADPNSGGPDRLFGGGVGMLAAQ